MEHQLKLQIETECTTVLIAFGRFRDQLNAEGAAGLMACDGIWDRDGELLSGPDRIRQVIAQMPSDLILRHLFSNIVIDVTDEQHAKAVAYYTVYGDRNAPISAERPVKLLGPTRVGDYFCDFVKEDGAWRISYVTARRVFST